MLISDERYSPGSIDLCTGYEHIHRYLFALRYTRGKKVLDLACGEGYGSALLAQSASEVIGIDIFPDAIAHARTVYPMKNLSFQLGAMECIPLKDLFDVIVCFEAIEHIANHDALCTEVKRLLKPSGIFIISTPNKPVYSENGKTQNPYHVKELDLTELQTLLGKHFQYQYLYGQKTTASSRIFSLYSSSNSIQEQRIQMQRDRFDLTAEEDPLPRYYIALSSDEKMQADKGVFYLTDTAARKGFAQWVTPGKTRNNQGSMLRKFLKPLKQKIFKILHRFF